MPRMSRKIIVASVIVILGFILFVYFLFTMHSVPTRVEQTEHQHASTTPHDLTIDDLSDAVVPDFASDSDKTITLSHFTNTGTNTLTNNGNSKDDITLQTETTIVNDSGDYAYADFNKDALQDVVAIIDWSGGGSGYFSQLAIFVSGKNGPQYLTSAFLGDRIQINSISVSKDNIISADIITQGPDDPLCCGTLRKVVRFSLTKTNELEEVK